MRFKKSLFIITLIFSKLVVAQSPKFELTIHVTDVEKTEGQIAIAIYNSESTFIVPQKHFIAFYSKAKKGTSTAKINLPTGQYAIAVFHDINSDEKLNTNALGIPEEPYGFSNNASGFFGPPSYKKAAFDFSKSGSINISL